MPRSCRTTSFGRINLGVLAVLAGAEHIAISSGVIAFISQLAPIGAYRAQVCGSKGEPRCPVLANNVPFARNTAVPVITTAHISRSTLTPEMLCEDCRR